MSASAKMRPMTAFFEREARFAVHLASRFLAMPAPFLEQHVDDVSWTGVALNEQLAWTPDFLAAHHTRFDGFRIFQNPAIVWTDAMRALFPSITGGPLVHVAQPDAETLGDAISPYAYGCTLETSRPLASLTLDEAEANLRHLAWDRVLTSPHSPWTNAWSARLGPLFEEDHVYVSNAPARLLRRLYDDLCVPEMGADPLAFLASRFAKGPHYDFVDVAVGDAHGVLPSLDVDATALATLPEGAPVPASVNAYAQGPRRGVPIGGPQLLPQRSAGIVIDRAMRDVLAALVLPPHRFYEVVITKPKNKAKRAGDPLLLRFDSVLAEGDVLAQHYDMGIARRADRGDTFHMPQLVVSRRFAKLLRAQNVPNLSFSPAAVMRFSIAADAAPCAPLAVSQIEAPPPVTLTEEQAFFAARRARMQAARASLPATHVPEKTTLGKAESRLARIFPSGLAAFLKEQGTRRIAGYKLLSPTKFYLLDQQGYELEHPESWGAVAIAENGLGDCIGLCLRKDSDHVLAPTLHEFLHETGRVRTWSKQMG